MEASNNHLSGDAFLDDAAVCAIGATTAEEAAQFNAVLSGATHPQRDVAADLQDAAARLAAASPYMEPPAKLRAAILAATAPSTFKMEDYRRVADVRSNRYLRWGMAAAALCLMWSGYSIMSLRTHDAQLAVAVKQQHQQLENEQTIIREMLDPNVRQINLHNSKDQKVIGKMLVDSRTNGVTIVMPDAVIPPDTTVRMVIEHNGQKREITAMAVGAAPGSAFVHWQTTQAIDPNKPVNVQLNDNTRVASFGLQP